VSKYGGAAAFAAEAALWIAGAALIAGAAGMHWNLELPALNLNTLTGATPSAAASAGPSASAAVHLSSSPAARSTASSAASVAVASRAPSSTPAATTIVQKYRDFVARPDFQFTAKFTVSQTFTVNGTPVVDNQSGTMSYKAGDDTDSHTETVNGAATHYDYVHLGHDTYESIDGGAWTKSTRSVTEIASDRVIFTPTVAFIDEGFETKNGASLHRLAADQDAFSKALVKTTEGATDGQVTFTVWVGDDGTPAYFKLQGWAQLPVNGVSTKVTETQEFRVTATSGVTITSPI
jgi:hypothetical protein